MLNSAYCEKLEIFYPFTPRVIGVKETEIAQVHDNGFIDAVRSLQKEGGGQCVIHYLTDQSNAYSSQYKELKYYFHPISPILTKTLGNPDTSREAFGAEWSFSMIRHILFSPNSVACFFISGGWFAKFLALVSNFRRRPYLVIMGGWGIPLGRSQRWYLEKAAYTLVHTEYHRQWLHRERGIDLNKMVVFPIGIDTDLFQAKPLSFYSNPHPLHFLYVGRLIPSKGLYEALQAFVGIKQTYPDARMTVVGPWGNEQFRHRTEIFIQENGLETSVAFTGAVANDQLTKYYQSADLLLFPSQSESFGIVAVESMACGTPVIGIRNSGGPDEIIDHGENGLLLEPEQYDQGVLDLLKNREKLTHMSQAARSKIEKCYSHKRTYQQLYEMLAEIS